MLSRFVSFWFSLTPPSLALRVVHIWGAIAIACIVATIIMRRLVLPRVTATYHRTPWRRFANALVGNAIALFVLLFFRYEDVPFFGARFWILVLIASDLAWVGVLARHLFVQLPAARRAWSAEQEKRKYLR